MDMTPCRFPHSDICGSKPICSSPQLFAAYRVLLRLPLPRHSPCALSSLNFMSFANRLLFCSIFYHYGLFGITFVDNICNFLIVIAQVHIDLLSICFTPFSILFSFQGTFCNAFASPERNLKDFFWWAQVGSNHRPRAYQARALACWAMSPCLCLESRSLFPLVEMKGFEPLTPCLQGRCSPSWATPPLSWVLWRYFYVPSKLNNELRYLSYSSFPLLHLLWDRCFLCFLKSLSYWPWSVTNFSIERRWSSRTFRYGYLVTT